MRIRDVWQSLVTSGADLGTAGSQRRTFLLTLGAVAVVGAFINTLGVISTLHANPHLALIEPVIWEGSSWITLVSFFWIAWVAYCLAPPYRLSWRLLLHIPALLAFAVGHIGGFVLLCKAAYFAMGRHYAFTPFWGSFFYSLGRDALAYAVFMAAFTFTLTLLRQQQAPAPRPLTFDIRDGTKLNRVMIENILAVSSAGNYAEFVLRDGRKLCMRSPLTALERDLAPYGIVRTHRSWLVNAAAVTALNPAGSGDYTVSLGALTVPLSRRFPEALARLRAKE
jgi:DNA-binding LytR/AlgR family response regulator